MKSLRFELLAASAALALTVTLAVQPGQAQSASETNINAAVPTPDAGSVSSPTAKDTAAEPKRETPPRVSEQKPPVLEKKSSIAAPLAEKPAPVPLAARNENKTGGNESSIAEGSAEAHRSLPSVQVPLPNLSAPTEADVHITPPESAAKNDIAKGNVDKAEKPKVDVAKSEMNERQALPKIEVPLPSVTPPAAAEIHITPVETLTAAQEQESPNSNRRVAAQLKEMVASRLDHILTRRDERAGVLAFYKKRDYKPLWVSDGAADKRAHAAIAYLADVDADGLNPSDYPTPDFKATSSARDLAYDELKLTNAVLVYARDAQIGRIHFTRVGDDITFKLVAPEAAEVLANMANSKDVAAALDGYNPPQPGFKALKRKLAELRHRADGPARKVQEKKLVHVDEGPILRPGMRDRRVVQLRKRLDIGDTENSRYDEAVVDAVKAFQTQADIGVDGMVGPSTLRALNGERVTHRAPQSRIDTIIVNMERWRWLPRKLGNAQDTYVMVNVPDYTLSLMHDGKLYWKTNIVVGKPGKATPMISAEMKYITVNPTWNVPPSIIQNEYLPALQQDPNALDRIGLKIRQDPDGTVHIYQPPGAGNALGRIRFNFPNKFLVYQHDTPDKYLFKRAKRAYSHGCMRVQDPLEYATKLLSLELPRDHYTPAKIQSMFGSDEININFPRPIPVHLTYQTAFVDQNGKLQFRDDVYGRDAKMIAILKSARERRIAYIPVERAPNTSSRPVRMPVGTFAGDGGYGSTYGGGGGGGDFFSWLFGGQSQAQPPQQYYRPNHNRRFIGPRASDRGYYSRR